MGPPPKDPAVRARRNLEPQAEELRDDRESVRVPALPWRPKLPGGGRQAWHRNTRRWWRAAHRSPMAARYTEADMAGLEQLVELVDQFWWAPSPAAHAEIRLEAARYGLAPIDRMRLRWHVIVPGKPGKATPAPAPPATSSDPRAALHLVS